MNYSLADFGRSPFSHCAVGAVGAGNDPTPNGVQYLHHPQLLPVWVPALEFNSLRLFAAQEEVVANAPDILTFVPQDSDLVCDN